jgi:hypothetical protein
MISVNGTRTGMMLNSTKEHVDELNDALAKRSQLWREERQERLLRGLEGKETDVDKMKGSGSRLLLSRVRLQLKKPPTAEMIYTLIDPRTNLARYVGRSCNPEARYKGHVYKTANRELTVKGKWISELRALGLRPSMTVVENVESTTEKVIERERRWIFHYIQQSAPLTNREINMLPRLVTKLREATFNMLTEAVDSLLWHPLYCAEQLDIDDLNKAR